MSLYAFDFRDQLYGPWETARAYLVEQLDLLYAGLNAATILKDPTTGLVTGIGGNALNNVPTSALTVNLSTNATGVLPVANGGTGSSQTMQLPIAIATGVALVGNGTTGNKLTLQTDGTSIAVNGSNQLYTPIVEGTVLVARHTLTNTEISTLNTVPVQLIGASASGSFIRIFDVFARTRVGIGWTSNPTFRLIFHGDGAANTLAGGFQLPLGTNGDDKVNMTASSTFGPLNTTLGNGVAVDMFLTANPTGAGTGCSCEVVARYGVFAI